MTDKSELCETIETVHKYIQAVDKIGDEAKKSQLTPSLRLIVRSTLASLKRQYSTDDNVTTLLKYFTDNDYTSDFLHSMRTVCDANDKL